VLPLSLEACMNVRSVDSRSAIVVAILAVMLVVVILRLLIEPGMGIGTQNPDHPGAFSDRCVAAHGRVVGRGNKDVCLAADGSEIELP
jgi:hypothetical protein